MGKPGAQALERNPNWKGGRTIASNGYVLVKAPGHPAADSRGYVYEHRLVAELILGRPLRSGEEVHHRDANKENNSPENLSVMDSKAYHGLQHRRCQGRRLPGEANPLVQCHCGCGELFPKYDSLGRPRRFVTGHNMKGGELRGADSDRVDGCSLESSNGML